MALLILLLYLLVLMNPGKLSLIVDIKSYFLTPSQTKMRVDESWRGLQLSLAFDRQLSSTLIDFELVQILMRVDESLCVFDQSTLINSHLV